MNVFYSVKLKTNGSQLVSFLIQRSCLHVQSRVMHLDKFCKLMSEI